VDCDFIDMFTKHTRHSTLNILEAGMLQNLEKNIMSLTDNRKPIGGRNTTFR